MGDNRPESADSRLHDCSYTYTPPQCVRYDKFGTVPEDRVIGRAFMIIWPPSRIRILPIPSTFSQHGLNHAAALRSASERALVASAVPVRPSAPYLPLAGGLAAAVPLTALGRRLRLRKARRRRRGKGGPERRRGGGRDRRGPQAAGRRSRRQ